jgi:hypothetical protein
MAVDYARQRQGCGGFVDLERDHLGEAGRSVDGVVEGSLELFARCGECDIQGV